LPETGQRLRTPGGADNRRFGGVTVQSRGGSIPNPTRFNFENEIALRGYEMDTRTLRPGETLTLTLYWETLSDMENNYSIFIHVQGEDGEIWARMDSWLLSDETPTAVWEVDRRMKSHHPLILDPNTPPGVYDVKIGLYQSQNGQRLKLLAEDGFPLETRLFLNKIRVEP